MLAPVRLRRSTGTDRYAVVSVEPATEAGTFLVRVARGLVPTELTQGKVYGPYAQADLAEPFALAIEALQSEGFAEIVAGWEQFERLKSGDPTERCRAALRLAWRKRTDAVEPLIELATKAVDANRGEACVLVDALGMLGDPRAIPIANRLAEKKNLSRRRSGVEALRNLGDTDGLAAARERALARLPQEVRQALTDGQDLSALVAVVDACDPRRAGLIADVLYELGTPLTVGAARRILAKTTIDRPHIWRYVKSVLKRAMLRRDAKTFGFLAHAVERAAKTSKGTVATVKSGLTGEKKATRMFSQGTRDWVRRACWRYMRDLAKHEPHKYAATAAEVIVHYSIKDMKVPKGSVGAYGHCYLLGRVLWGGGDRVVLKGVRWRYVSAAAVSAKAAREESFPELWDAGREAFLRVLGGAKLPEVFAFGLDGLTRHPSILQQASVRQLLRLLDARDDLSAGTELVQWVTAELGRRFDLAQPDFAMITRLLMSKASARPAVRELVRGWLSQTVAQWSKAEQHVFQFPLAVDAALRAHVATLLIEAFGADAALRAEYAPGFLAILQSPETSVGQYAAFAKVAREALIAELSPMLDLDALLKWLDEGSMSGRAVAGALIGARPDAIDALGLERIVLMANDEVAAVRLAAHGILRQALDSFRTDPSPLYALAESDWSDTRDMAFTMLREDIDIVALGLEGLIGLCDSSDPEVEELGRDLVVKHFEQLDPEEVLYRLSEHPRQSMQMFALGLMHVHLREGYVPIARLERYFRAVLFDAWPSRRLKYGVIELLLTRGMGDAQQAELVAGLLGEILRTHTAGDFDRVAFALACLQSRYPELHTDLKLRAGGAA